MIRTLQIKISLLIILLPGIFGLKAQVMWQFNKDTVITWNYHEGDEFNNSVINLNYWQYSGSSRSLYSNKEQEYYTDGENHILSNGSLKLVAKKDSVFKRTVDWQEDSDSLFTGKKFESLNKKWHPYTSGELISKEKFNKGFFECRFKIPKQSGYWPAFWLYGGSPNEEIDMMECKTEKPKQIHIDTHCGNKCDLVRVFLTKKSYGGWIKTAYNFSDGFNIAACSWDENQIRFYLNGECVGVSNVKFNVEKNLAINLAVPSDNGPFHPGPSQRDSGLAVFEIDYVRVWKKNATKTVDHKGVTHLDTSNAILTGSMVKTKKKIVYGKKTEHKNESVFVSFFQTENAIQLYALGKFETTKPIYKIKASDGNVVVSGEIYNQIQSIPSLKTGLYDIIVDCVGQSRSWRFEVK